MGQLECAERIKESIKRAGIDLVATLPDEKMVELIKSIGRDAALKHIPLCREEEGVGICAGAYLAGMKCALLMQNAGFLNSCNALTTTALQFEIPLLMLIYYAGDIGDRGFATVGSVTEPMLQGLGIRTYTLRRVEGADEIIAGAQVLAEDSKRPVAVLLTKTALGAA